MARWTMTTTNVPTYHLPCQCTLFPLQPQKDKAVPIYEYRCAGCHRRVSIWWKTFGEAEAGKPVCPRCGGTELRRLMSRVAVLRSEASRLENLDDPSAFGDIDENDPRSIGRWMRRMSAEMGEDLGDEMTEMVDRLEAGESPEAIEASMPDLAGDMDTL